MIQGLVMNTQKGLYNVKTEVGLLKCKLRGKLFKEQQTTKTLVVVGDKVLVEHLHGDQGLILEICARKSKLSRRGAGKKGKHLEQLIAVNIDQAILVFAAKNPPYNRNLIDRYIAACEAGGIEPIVCINKTDLIELVEVQIDVEYYRQLGYIVIYTSTLTGEGIAPLSHLLKDKLTVFSGSSGVGKSSLVNALFERELTQTGAVGETTHKGRHTTTSTQIYELPTGGMIVDTPGMREFGLFDAAEGVRNLFSDIEKLAINCKFSNCTHSHEPGCAVKRALDEGDIDPQRYESYQKLNSK